jgi:hypothetical protein
VISFFGRPMSPGSMDLQVDGGSRSGRHAFAAAGVPLASGFSVDANGDYQEGGGYRLIGQNGAIGPVDVASTSITRNAYARLNYSPSSTWSAFATGHFFGDSRGSHAVERGQPRPARRRFRSQRQGVGGAGHSRLGWSADREPACDGDSLARRTPKIRARTRRSRAMISASAVRARE